MDKCTIIQDIPHKIFILFQKKKLDDNMILSLASLNDSEYKLYREIVSLCEQGKIKKTKKCALGLNSTKVDCKGSNFRGLRGLTNEEIKDMLLRCSSGEIALKELNQTCMNMKKMKKIKETFVANVGLKDWKEAQTMYPLFANEKSLGDLFLQCSFTPVPSVFSEYCSKAVK